MPEAFFGGEQPLSLDERPFDLAVVDRGVNRAADVHLDVRAQASPVACQSIDFDLGGRDALGEVVVHLAGIGTPDVADVRGLIEAVGGEVDAVEVGGFGKLFHCSFWAEFLSIGCKARV